MRLKCKVVFFLIICILLSGSVSLAASYKATMVKINTVSISVNGKILKIDNFSYLNDIYVQPQDISSALNIEYTYNSKSKTIAISSKMPVKPIALAKSKFKSVKVMSSQSINIVFNSASVKINAQSVKLNVLQYDGAFFVSIKEFARLLNEDFLNDGKTVTINDKKPTKPTLSQDIITQIEKCTIMIKDWGNAVTKEYKIGNGKWQKYTSPIVMTNKGVIYARGTNAAGIQSDVASLDVNNIHRLLSKVEIGKQNSLTVKVVYYDVNGVELGSGSGFFISPDGKVVTNFHVIDMKTVVKVITTDNKTYNVSGVVAYNAKEDIAILKLETEDTFDKVYLGNSNELDLGEDVVAIGYPLGLPVSVAGGNISSINTPGILGRLGYTDIQFTSPISPGNSGGPLFNMYGEVVGINYSTMVKGQNLNYAIPINELKPFLKSNNLIKLADVIKQEYPSMDYSEFSSYIFYNYPDYVTGNYKFSFSNVTIQETGKDPNELDVYIDMSFKQYAEILLAETENNKKEVEKWAEDIYTLVKSHFGDKNIHIIIGLYDSTSTKPTGYMDYEISYNTDTGYWNIYRVKLEYHYVNSLPQADWKQ